MRSARALLVTLGSLLIALLFAAPELSGQGTQNRARPSTDSLSRPDELRLVEKPGTEAPSEQSAPDQRLELRVGYYDNGDDLTSGNPFLDESLTVIEPIILYEQQLSDELALYGQFQYDAVSSASIDRLSRFPEQSGASGDYYLGLRLGMRKKLDETRRWGAWFHGSVEYDYRSVGLGGDYAWDAPDKNATTKLAGNVFFDGLDLIRFNGVEEGSDTRLSLTTSLTRYQVLSRVIHAEYGATLTYQSGALETPYNAVVLLDPAAPPNPNLFNMARGLEVTERMPDTRIRGAVHGKLRRALGESFALEGGARIYADSWGITSYSAELQGLFWLMRDKLRARVRYRFYDQSAADDYARAFFEADRNRQYFTQDSDLGSFDTHTIGIGLDLYASKNFEFGITADLVDRSDGIDQTLASIYCAWSF